VATKAVSTFWRDGRDVRRRGDYGSIIGALNGAILTERACRLRWLRTAFSAAIAKLDEKTSVPRAP
jgi:hypothetical protein